MQIPTIEQMAKQYCEDRLATAKALREQAAQYDVEAEKLRKQAENFEELAKESLKVIEESKV